MLLFGKAPCFSLHLTSSAILLPFSTSLLECHNLRQDFSLSVLIHCHCLLFFCSLNSILSSIFYPGTKISQLQHNYVKPSVLNDMFCLDIKISLHFDPIILNYACTFVIILLNLTN